jgi:hypothetical protein
LSETFTILDDGETLITGEWAPSVDDLSLRMLALADAYDDMMAPLLASRQAAMDATEAHFDSESSPDGVPWPALNEDYLAKKVSAGYPEDEILVATGTGKDRATSTGAWFISEDALWFDANALPAYMAYHQAGTSGLTPEQHGVLSKLRKGEPITIKEAGIAVEASGGRGQNLPQREFIGFGEIDTLVFEDIWNTWFASQIVEEFPSGGTNFGGLSISNLTGFNMLGEFPIIGHTGRGQPILRTPQGPRFGRM